MGALVECSSQCKIVMHFVGTHDAEELRDGAVDLESTQSNVLKMELSADPRLSTLRKYIDGLAAVARKPAT